ncbi:DUF2059 domain-containing protein [Altererythrobacter luteolus]|uniref:DUF2059 domain-containing protein n=1 Tax=Pontixanthobacter luteolus TaxID=295089 RepID=A0A6I4V834_9SPHN|nr:DUF2059 domain-containing protein [Pontixanthobacter luteolus]MXP48022.1 DUF2059 domain-containing protein [Pontixanthobacter luteolus]
MLKNSLFALALAGAAIGSPLAAQEQTTTDARMMEAMGEMFGKAQPLTAEQEARLPEAQLVVASIFPEGTYAKMMGDTMEPMMGSIMDAMVQMPTGELAELTGLPVSELENMGETAINDAMAIMDPAYQERTRRIAETSVKMMTDVMTEIEPGYRDGLARAYAVRFSVAELKELNAFFTTPTGSHYAAESMLIYADPQVMSAMNEVMPAVMEMMPQMIEAIGEVTAELAAPRQYSELTEEEKAALSGILGMDQDKLAAAEPEIEETAGNAEEGGY